MNFFFPQRSRLKLNSSDIWGTSVSRHSQTFRRIVLRPSSWRSITLVQLVFNNWRGARSHNACIFNKKVKIKCTLVQALRLCTGRTAHRGSRGIALLFLARGTGRAWGFSVTPRPLFTPGKTQYPLYRRLGGPQGRSGQVREIAPPPGFDPRTIQPVASRYTDWFTRSIFNIETANISFRVGRSSFV